MSQINRILIATKYRFIGDTVLSVPAIRAASKYWPNARISLLTGPKALEFVQNCPFVHDRIEFDPYRKADQGAGRFLAVSKLLRERNFDLALVLNRSFHSALLATFGGAKIRVGWSKFAGRDFLLSGSCPYGLNDPEIDSYLDIVRCAYEKVEGKAPEETCDRSLQLWLSDAERANTPRELSGNYKYIGIQPGATHDYKRWPADRFAALADEIVRGSEERRLVLFGGPEEKPFSDVVMGRCTELTRSRCINLTGQLPLRGTLSALLPLSFFVGNDTAIRHAAMCLDVPTLGLFGPTSALKWGNETLPRHKIIAAQSGRIEDIELERVAKEVEDFFFSVARRTTTIEPNVIGNYIAGCDGAGIIA